MKAFVFGVNMYFNNVLVNNEVLNSAIYGTKISVMK